MFSDHKLKKLIINTILLKNRNHERQKRTLRIIRSQSGNIIEEKEREQRNLPKDWEKKIQNPWMEI